MAKKNKKKDGIVKFSIIISIILSIILLVAGFLYCSFQKSYYKLEYSEDIYVSVSSDITLQNERAYSDNFYLQNDISLDISTFSFGSKDLPFEGTFDGNGHTVTCIYSASDNYASVFEYISSSGKIINTNFIFKNVSINSNLYAGIAIVNYGEIKNCKIVFNSLTISQTSGVFSAGVEINKGIISNVVSECAVYGVEVDESKTNFGAICAFNYGTVEKCIATPTYSGFECTIHINILAGETTNYGIAAICSISIGNAITQNNAILLEDGTYTLDSQMSTYLIFSDKSEIFTSEVVFDKLDFDNRIWIIKNSNIYFIV